MRRQGMSTTLTRSRRRPFFGSCLWIWVLPAVALARLVLFAAGVDGQLLQLLLKRQLPDHLLPLMEPLQVVVQSQVPPVVLFVTASKSCHLTNSQCEQLAVHLEPSRPLFPRLVQEKAEPEGDVKANGIVVRVFGAVLPLPDSHIPKMHIFSQNLNQIKVKHYQIINSVNSVSKFISNQYPN